MSDRPQKSYHQILKSSALIGGSSVLNIITRVIRSKVIAVILGPSGVGLLGLYNSISDIGKMVAGMGTNTSGVREIADAIASGDTIRVGRVVTALRRIAICLGIAGAVLLVMFSVPVSIQTFGDADHIPGVVLLSLAVFFGVVSGGQSALVQGARRIGDLARIGVWGAFFGAASSVILICIFRERGIALSLVATAGMSILASWWYVHADQGRAGFAFDQRDRDGRTRVAAVGICNDGRRGNGAGGELFNPHSHPEEARA